MVTGCAFDPVANVVMKEDPPLVIVVYTSEALGDPKIIVPDDRPLAGIVLVKACESAGIQVVES